MDNSDAGAVRQKYLLHFLYKYLSRYIRMCMHVCMCVHVCMCTYVYVCMHMYMHVCMHACMMYMYVHYSSQQSADTLEQCYSAILTFLKDCHQHLSHPESICLLTRYAYIHVFCMETLLGGK